MYKRVNYSFYSLVGDGQNENLRIIHTLSTGFPHSYQYLLFDCISNNLCHFLCTVHIGMNTIVKQVLRVYTK